MRGEWRSDRALAIVADAGRLEDIPIVAQQLGDACLPCPAQVLIDRLTLLGMTMVPNRPPAEAKAWLHEFGRLLGDIPRDILLTSIDDLQKRLKFLPTVAEIREIADPLLDRRRKQARRSQAMVHYLESGQPIPKLSSAAPAPIARDEPLTAEQIERANSILASARVTTRFRDDGEIVQVDTPKAAVTRTITGPPRQPTRADYIALGIDPAVLDRIEAEQAQARTS